MVHVAPRNEPTATIAERPTVEAEIAPDVGSSPTVGVGAGEPVVSFFVSTGAGESGQAIIVQALTPFSVQVQVLHPSEDK